MKPLSFKIIRQDFSIDQNLFLYSAWVKHSYQEPFDYRLSHKKVNKFGKVYLGEETR